MRLRSTDASWLYKAVIKDVAHRYGLTADFELKFHPKRRWRFDGAIARLKIGIEIDGSVWSQGRHTRGKGFIADQEKEREAVILGWAVLRFCTADVKSGVLANDLERLILARAAERAIDAA